MHLQRNEHDDGLGKYIAVKVEALATRPTTPEELAAAILAHPEAVMFGRVGERDEFFLMMLKDKNADGGLYGYAANAATDDLEYASQVAQMATRAGKNSPFCKNPD